MSKDQCFQYITSKGLVITSFFSSMFQYLNHLIHLRWNQDICVNSLDFSLSDRQLKISYFSTSSILAYCNYFMELAIKIYDGFKIHLILKVKAVNTSSLVKHKSCHTFWKLKRNTIPSVSHLLCFLSLIIDDQAGSH